MRGALIGRERELTDMLAAVDDAFKGRGAVFLLAGEPGIGKTTLAGEVATRAAERGARVAGSRSWEGGEAAPYWMWAQIVRSLVDDVPDETLRSFLPPGTERVALLAPELPSRLGITDTEPLKEGLDSDAGRFYLFESTARFLRHVSAMAPLVLILDDVLTGDEPSLQLLRFLARDVRSQRMLIVATYRDGGATQLGQSADVLADLVREGTGLDLRGLDREQVAHLIADVAGVVPVPGKVAAIHEATGGNPLFVREVTRLLASEEPLDRPGRLRVRVPDTVRAVIRRRLAPLSADAVQVLSAAAVVGTHFDLALVDAACDLPADRIVASLGEAMALGVVVEAQGAARRYRFSHPLMREGIYEGLPVAARTDMHHRVGVAIERLHGPDSATHLGDLAYHFAMAAVKTETCKACEYARRAGDRAMDSLAYEQAVVQYRRALDALTLSGQSDPTTQCELLLRLGRAQTRAGDYQQARSTFLLAADLARESGTPQQFALAALGRGEPQVEGGLVDHELVGLLEEALARLSPEDSALRVKLLARLSLELTFADNKEVRESRRQALSLNALDMARRLENVRPLFSALRARWLAQWGPDGLEERSALCDEWLTLALETGNREMEMFARARRATCSLEAGDVAASDIDLAAHAKLAEELRVPYHEWATATMRAGRALFTGAFEGAEALTREALEHMPGRPNALHAHMNQLTTLRWAQGRLGELHGTWRDQVERFPQLSFLRGWLCLAAADAGRDDEARSELERLLGLIPEMPRNGVWLPAIALATSAAARLQDEDAAGVLYPLLRPYAEHVVLISMPHPAICFGSASLYLGLLAAERADWDSAEQHFAAAAEANRRLGAAPFTGRAYCEHARALVRRGHASDRGRAGALLDRASDVADDIQMPCLLRDILAVRGQLPGTALGGARSSDEAMVVAATEAVGAAGSLAIERRTAGAEAGAAGAATAAGPSIQAAATGPSGDVAAAGAAGKGEAGGPGGRNATRRSSQHGEAAGPAGNGAGAAADSIAATGPAGDRGAKGAGADAAGNAASDHAAPEDDRAPDHGAAPDEHTAAPDHEPDLGLEPVGSEVFRREGEYWTIVHEGTVVRLRDTKGLRCLSRLLANPGREIAAVELEAMESESPEPALVAVGYASASGELDDVRPDLGDAGALLDDQAKADYRSRIHELRAELEEAEEFNDPGRAVRAQEELEFLTNELARAVGLGGRDRRAASHAERARLNVTRAVRSSLRTLAKVQPRLGEHLAATIRTGRYCSYTPDPRAPIDWVV